MLQCDEVCCSVLQCVVLAMIYLTEVDVAYNHLKALPPQLKHFHAKKKGGEFIRKDSSESVKKLVANLLTGAFLKHFYGIYIVM